MLNSGKYWISAGRTVKERRNAIIARISMRSEHLDWDYAIDLAREWNNCDEKYLFLESLGEWDICDSCDRWIDRVERHLERILIASEGISRQPG